MAEYDEDIKKIVKKRLAAMPPDISFSIGKFGDFSRDELIQEVEKGGEIGEETIEMQLDFIKKMPTLLKKTKKPE